MGKRHQAVKFLPLSHEAFIDAINDAGDNNLFASINKHRASLEFSLKPFQNRDPLL